MIKEVSLIIPYKSDEEKLSILLSSMLDWKATPNEIIIINTIIYNIITYCINTTKF